MSCQAWRPVVASLERKYQCLIYDARGIARSQPVSPNANFQVEDHSDDLRFILEFLDLFDATIVGHELGALVGAHCAVTHPQHVRSLVLVSPRAAFSEGDIRKLSVFTPASLALRELATFPVIRNLVAWRFRSAPQPFRDILFEEFSELNPRAAYETALSAADPQNTDRLRHLVERFEGAVLIISGENDKKGVIEARELFATVEGGKLATMRSCGFLPMLEYPSQFARLVNRFVATHAGKGALSRRS
jgi:pimeloyl-ACP methyl ester carboxylesterase